MSAHLETPRLLVVDDDKCIREMLIMALERAGYTVDAAKDGVEGLAMLRANKYDLLISDNQMPRLTGVEMVQQLHFERITLPIIMASGTLQPQDVVGLDIPVVTMLTKPYSLLDLLALVKTILTADGTGRGTRNG